MKLLLQILIVLLLILLTNCNGKRQNNIEVINEGNVKEIHVDSIVVEED